MKKDVLIEWLLGIIGILWIFVIIIQKPTTTIQKQTVVPNETQKGLSISNIQSHNTEQNCWIIISNNVYNVTTYISDHPGGIESITAYCGSDATVAFQTKNGKGPHSTKAEKILQQYFIGTVQ